MIQQAEQLACLCCGGRDRINRIRQWTAQELVKQWQAAYSIDVRDEFAGVDTVTLMHCQGCDLQWFDPPVAGSEVLYEKLQRFDWYYQPYKWEHGQALRDLQGAKQVLEVGCGSGAFLKLVSERLHIQAYGIELNKPAVAAARAAGCSVQRRDINDIQRQYDAVCAFQVLEHVPDPQPFISACCRLIRPGGRLLLAVPNAQSFLRHGTCLLDMPPHHTTRWTTSTLHGLTDRFALSQARIRREPLATYHIQDYVNTQWRAWTGMRFGHPRVALNLLGDSLQRSGVHRWLTGHTLYACFTRDAAP